MTDIRNVTDVGELAIANSEGHIQNIVINGVMVKITVMLIERFAMVGGEDNNGIVFSPCQTQRFKDLVDAHVHVGDAAVILRNDIFSVRATFREPGQKVIAEGLELVSRLQRFIVLVKLIARVEKSVKRPFCIIRRVWVHMPHEKQPWLILFGKSFKLRNGGVIHVLGLVRHPIFIFDVFFKSARCRVALETDAGGCVAVFAEYLRQRFNRIK